MSVAISIITASRCSLSNGCRVASLEGCVTSSSQRKSRYPTSTPLRSHHVSTKAATSSNKSRNGSLAAATTACVMCHSLRMTAACSASSGIHNTLSRHGNVKHVSTAAHTKSLTSGRCTQMKMIQNETVLNPLSSSAIASHSLPALTKSASIHTTSKLPSTVFVSNALYGLSSQTINNTAVLGDGTINNTTNWGAEIFGAMCLASTAVAGSLFLGPFGNYGDSVKSGGGGGGYNGGGGGGGGYKKIDGGGGGNESKYEEESGMEVKVGIASVPPAYEVSVRALRGGRLSMEDEFIVVDGGRLSAVFDGHGGGGVSQYLRDHLHIILSEQLEQQKKNMNRKSTGEHLKAFMFGKGKNNNKQDGANDDKGKSNEDNSSRKYDLSGLGDLPVSAVANALKDSFDQVDKEILANDEYEYQGSTAVAVLLHEANDGVRTLLSANIGDSRGILARDGKAVDLTRDHKPNDDKEKARILAMGEKIEWDHYCKVHRVRNLSLSRAVGDRFAKPAVSGEVEIQRFPVKDDKDEFILLASDGLWDVMTSQEVVSYVHKRMTAAPKDGADIKTEEDMQSLKYLRRKNMSRFIANEALRRGSGDNISVVMVWLKTI